MKNKVLNVDIVSDVVCPWCVIGYGRFKQALASFDEQLTTSVTWHPFELNPEMPHQGENLRKHLSEKYGTTLDGSIRARAMLTEEGRKVGFTFNYFDEMKMLNTHDCHQLIHWANGSGKQLELSEALFEQFFTHQGGFEKNELIKIVEKVGLDTHEATEILLSQKYSGNVKTIEHAWHQKGIHGVPLFIFNNTQVLSGAQEIETFKGVIKDLIYQY